ncbi:MAG: hypothetical protein IJY94_06700 [Clostridia bacterium]|nr:hypothetical protein [Clostridia bacterium]
MQASYSTSEKVLKTKVENFCRRLGIWQFYLHSVLDHRIGEEILCCHTIDLNVRKCLSFYLEAVKATCEGLILCHNRRGEDSALLAKVAKCVADKGLQILAFPRLRLAVILSELTNGVDLNFIHK